MSGDKIVLRAEGLSHVPSKKNSKMWTGARLITKPEYQEWIKQCILSFESQLLSLCRTGEGEMLMEPSQRWPIAWSKQFDDSVQWIISEHCEVVFVTAGNEGATLTLEEI